jgi:hypothetical protein
MGYYLLCILYALLGWPESLLTWDICSYPGVWTGPVIAPRTYFYAYDFAGHGYNKISGQGIRTVKIGKAVWVSLLPCL